MIFFIKTGIFCKSVAGPLIETKTHWMVNWLQLLDQLNFIWRHTKVFMHNSSQWCFRNVQLLRTTVNWCWWRFIYTFCHSNNILGCTHCFWLITLWFIDEDASFFHQMRQFCLLTYPPRSKWTSSEKMILFFLPKSASSVRQSQAHLAKRKHTYIIGDYNPSVRIIELVVYITYVVCVNFIHKLGHQ